MFLPAHLRGGFLDLRERSNRQDCGDSRLRLGTRWHTRLLKRVTISEQEVGWL